MIGSSFAWVLDKRNESIDSEISPPLTQQLLSGKATPTPLSMITGATIPSYPTPNSTQIALGVTEQAAFPTSDLPNPLSFVPTITVSAPTPHMLSTVQAHPTPNQTEVAIGATALAKLLTSTPLDPPVPVVTISPAMPTIINAPSHLIWDFVLGGLFVLLVMACFLLWVTLKSDQRDLP